MTGRKKHLRVLKDLRIQHEAYISTDPNAKMYEKEDKDIADALDYVISVLEQEPILAEIRAEIEQKIEQERFARSVFRGEEKDAVNAEQCTGSIFAYNNVIKIIDKYKAESEDKE